MSKDIINTLSELPEKIINMFIDLLFPKSDKELLVEYVKDTDFSDFAKVYTPNDSIHSLFSYKDPKVQALIWELKYKKNRKSIEILGKILSEHIIEELSDKKIFDGWENPLLVGVPITNKSFRERGFCQTELLCLEIVKHIGNELTYSKNAILKTRETEKQSHTKNRQERLNNLKDVFKADEKIVSKKFIILIDDVTTTGATIGEVKNALLKAGAKDVMTFTVAH